MNRKIKKNITRQHRDFASGIDTISKENPRINDRVYLSTLKLAIEIAREGREGRKIGTMFVIGDVTEVISSSKTLILDPLKGHPERSKLIEDPNMRETVKELAQLDGAFIISNEGVVMSATRYIDVDSKDVELPLGLGSRHMAAASITKKTSTVAIVVSESSVVRVFDRGKIIAEIIPELWLIQRAQSVTDIINEKKDEGGTYTVVSRNGE
jgi:diadenylate cyclase